MLKSKKKIFLMLIIICLIVLTTLILSLQIQKRKTNYVVHSSGVGPRNDRYLQLSGFGVFFDKYKGELSSSDISSKLENITTKEIPELYDTVKEYDDDELKNYYNNNINNMKLLFGKSNYSEFLSFIELIKAQNIDLKTWERLDILKETFLSKCDKEGYSYVEYDVTYSNSGKIRFSLYISKSENQLPVCIIDIVK